MKGIGINISKSWVGLIFGLLFTFSTSNGVYASSAPTVSTPSILLPVSSTNRLTPPTTTPEEHTPSLPDPNIVTPDSILPSPNNNGLDKELIDPEMADGGEVAMIPDNEFGSPPGDSTTSPSPSEVSDGKYYIFINASNEVIEEEIWKFSITNSIADPHPPEDSRSSPPSFTGPYPPSNSDLIDPPPFY